MYKRPKGTQDIFGEKQKYTNYIISLLETMSKFYNYKKIDTPIFESNDLFTNSVGETTDIVSKEMYNFKDKKGRNLVLKPEGTASIIRAFIENKLFSKSMPVKLFYITPLFRYERPQKGRQRQFTQFGVELIGSNSPAADAEIIIFGNNILKQLKINKTKLLINSLGDKDSRDNYSKALKKFLNNYKEQLSEISIKRLNKNPLRILDDKLDSKKEFMKKAPKLSEFLNAKSKNYLKGVLDILDASNVEYELSEKLVRGLDYYTDIVFEFVSESKTSGSQSTLIGGGRYDNMINKFGGPELPATGFGLGIERIVNELEDLELKLEDSLDIYLINLEIELTSATSALVNMLRMAGFKVESNLSPIKLNKGFEKAKNEKAKFVIIAGSKELKEGKVIIKNQETAKQDKISIEKIVDFLNERL
ncbi:MAG: histidine--tRNA ligase [Mycoplasma sp.]|nr:histidine--tRNA ligase [Mycoplasma sp.]